MSAISDWEQHALDALQRRGYRSGGAGAGVVELLGARAAR